MSWNTIKNKSLDLIKETIDGELISEEFRPVVGYEGIYEISSFGRLKKLGRWLKSGKWKSEQIVTSNGGKKKLYLKVSLIKNGKIQSMSIHRLVGFAFIPLIEGKPHINHKDCRHTNNYYKNLEWCTPQENNEHAVQMGISKRGRKPYIKKGYDVHFKPVINIETGEKYKSRHVVAELMGYKVKYFGKQLSGKRLNTTPFRYVGGEHIQVKYKERIRKYRPIAIFNFDNKLIKEYEYIEDVIFFIKCKRQDINDFLKGKRSHVKGFKFKLIDDNHNYIEPIPFISKKKPPKPPKPKGEISLSKEIIKYDLSGQELYRFESTGQLAIHLGINKSNIRKVIKGKGKGRPGYYKGFFYKYAK